MNIRLQYDATCLPQFRLGLISDYVRLSLAEFKLKMYHYLHRPWYTKHKSTIYHSWQEPQLCNQVYGILMSFILNKHITIFTDNDMYHANLPKHKVSLRRQCVNTLDLQLLHLEPVELEELELLPYQAVVELAVAVLQAAVHLP